jgi:hypothetical protein
MKVIISLLALLSVSTESFSGTEPSRRAFLSNLQTTVLAPAVVIAIQPSIANAAGTVDLVNDLAASREKLKPIPDLLQAGEWDKVRTILKTPPVNQLWNLGESRNTLVKLAKETGEFELLELKDELAISLQICDQLTYDNTFIYSQPGSGKVKVKEPTDLALMAMSQLDAAIKMAGN